MSRRAIFLDRDGTLNRERGYVTGPHQLELLPGATDAVQELDRRGWPIVVVTNQSGIAKGLYTHVDLARVHAKLDAALRGLPLAYLHCPHHPEGTPGHGHEGECECRKPGDGLLRQASRWFDLDLDHSVLIGDSARDLTMAAARPLRRVLVQSGKPWQQELDQLGAAGVRPDAVVADLSAAVAWLRD